MSVQFVGSAGWSCNSPHASQYGSARLIWASPPAAAGAAGAEGTRGRQAQPLSGSSFDDATGDIHE
eukprot:6196838-Pleurochrysis_carterae.AAC.3